MFVTSFAKEMFLNLKVSKRMATHSEQCKQEEGAGESCLAPMKGLSLQVGALG